MSHVTELSIDRKALRREGNDLKVRESRAHTGSECAIEAVNLFSSNKSSKFTCNQREAGSRFRFYI